MDQMPSGRMEQTEKKEENGKKNEATKLKEERREKKKKGVEKKFQARLDGGNSQSIPMGV